MITNIEEQLNHDVSLQRLAESAGIKLKGKGPVLTGTCPFHSRTSPALTITTTTNTWACPSCRTKTGSVIDFVMKAEGISRRHAIELLRGDHGGGGGNIVKESSVKKLPDVITQDGDDATLLSQVTFYSDSLKRDSKAMAFLAASKITSSEVIDKFQLGLSDRSLGYRIPKANRKAGAEVRARLQKLGILKDTGHEALRGCITIPIRDENGVIEAVYGRRIEIDARKTDSPDVYVGNGGLFNMGAFTGSKDTIVVATPFEALILWSSGIRNVTALMGLDDDGKMLVEAIMKNGTTKVVTLLPRTKEGDKATTKLIHRMANLKVQLFKAGLPVGMDVVTFAATGNTTEKMMEVIRAAEWIGGTRPTTIEPTPSTIVQERSTDTPAMVSEKTTPAGEISIAELPEGPLDETGYYLDGTTRPLVAVAPDKFERGFTSADTWVWPSVAKSPGGVTDAYEVVELAAALARPFRTDAHLVPYVLLVGDDRVLARQPRLTLGCLPCVTAKGVAVRFTCQIADVDNPDHAVWTTETLKAAAEKLVHPSLAGCAYYTTRAGLRIIRVPDRWLSLDEHRATLPLWLDQLAAVGLPPDRACLDWTRHFRLPRVVRDGKPTSPSGRWTWVPYHVGEIAIPKAPKPTERDRLIASLATTRSVGQHRRGPSTEERRLVRAENYLRAVPPPACGTGSCERVVFHVACLLVEGFALDEAEAAALLSRWAAAAEHGWKPAELLRKVTDAAKRAKDPGFLLRGSNRGAR